MTLQFERDLQIARQIQASFLPEELPQPPGWEIAACFRPAHHALGAAGDFYDAFFLIQNRRIGLVIADVCGKGVGAALYMALFRTLIRAFAQQHYSLRWIDALSDDRPTASAKPRQTVPSIGLTALKTAVELTNHYIAQTHGRATMFATLFFELLWLLPFLHRAARRRHRGAQRKPEIISVNLCDPSVNLCGLSSYEKS